MKIYFKALKKKKTSYSSFASHFYVQWNCMDVGELDQDSSSHSGIHVKCHFPYDNLKISYSKTSEISKKYEASIIIIDTWFFIIYQIKSKLCCLVFIALHSDPAYMYISIPSYYLHYNFMRLCEVLELVLSFLPQGLFTYCSFFLEWHSFSHPPIKVLSFI